MDEGLSEGRGTAEPVTVDPEGADEPLVILWDGGATTVGVIRDVCKGLERNSHLPSEDQPKVKRVYVRDGDDLFRVFHRVCRVPGGEVEVRVSYDVRCLRNGPTVALGWYRVA